MKARWSWRGIFAFLLGAWLPISSSAHPLDHWHQRNPAPAINALYSVAHGNDRWVAVGDGWRDRGHAL